MARQVLPIVGAVAGFVISGGNPMGAQIGFAAGSLIGNAVDPLEVKGNTIGDNPLQTASEGGARAIVFGKGCIRSTCILERGNRIVRKQRDQAGKGGGPVTINERVFWTFSIGLGEDLVGGTVLRIWEGEKLVYDVTPSSAIPEESLEFAAKFRFYDGAETQLPDPDLEAIHGVENAPYYRGTAYVVFPNFDLTDYREAIPVYRWEVSKTAGVIDPIAVNIWDKLIEWYDAGEIGGAIVGQHAGDSLGLRTRGVGPHAQISFEGAVGDAVKFTGANGANDSSGFASDFDSFLPQNIMDTDYANMVVLRQDPARDMPAFNTIAIRISSVSEFDNAGGVNAFAVTAQVSGSNLQVDMGSMGTGLVAFPSNEWFMLKAQAWIVDPTTKRSKVRVNGAPFEGGGHFGATRSSTLHEFQRSISGRMSNNNTNFIRGLGEGVEIDEWAIFSSTLSDEEWDWLYNAGSFRGYDDLKNYSGNGETTGPLEPIALSQVVEAIHVRCNQFSLDYDVSELTDEIMGVVFEQSVTGAEAINSLIGAYFADPSDYDGQIHYVKRGKPVVKTLNYDDLVDEPDTTQRQNPVEYPRKLHFFFQSSITAYAATKATSARSSPDLNTVVGEVSVASPVTFDSPDEPAQISAKLHKVNWTDAEGEIVWELTDEQLDLVPTDCVGLSLRGRVTRARITHIEDSNGIRKLTMRVDRQSAYTSDVTGIPLPTPTPPQSSILSPTVNAYMDIPALLDAHNLSYPIYYDGMSGQTDVWPGAVLQRSLDGGSTWTNVTATTLNAIIGILQEAVTDASPYYTDTTNQVVVRLYMDDEIESISNTAFKSEGGAFALSWEDSGQQRWEIMQYRDAHQDSNGDWVLTTLHRGRLNTESVEHPPGSTFVFLDTAVRLVTAQSAWIDTELTHRAVTNGLSPESATQETEPFTAQAQIEWPVAHLFLEQDSTGDTTATVVPRNRFGTSLNPIRSITWTGYHWTVTDGSNTINMDGTSETEVFDTSGWGPVTVSVSQLNLITGPGPSVSETIP